MSQHFTTAFVRPPDINFGQGLTTANLGLPSYQIAIKQHEAYCKALERCGLNVIRLDPDPNFPDSTFVEDVAVVARHMAVVTRPGAPSRRGEIVSIRSPLLELFGELHQIQPPGLLDGGDVCQIDEEFLIGVTSRTNRAGAEQLVVFLASAGYSARLVDIEAIPGSLHLKSGISYLGGGRLAIIEAFKNLEAFKGFDLVHVPPGEEYAANSLRLNDCLLVPAGYPKFKKCLSGLDYLPIEVELSEFQKMDGGLSCLSLRF